MFKRLLKFVTAYPQLFLDPTSSRRAKFLPLAALVYLIMPIDLVPDMIPLLGEVDDIGLIILFISIALKAFEQSPEQKKAKKYGEIIDVKPVQKGSE